MGCPDGDFPDVTSALAPAIVQWVGESQRDIRHALGSNNWVVSGASHGDGQADAGERYASGTERSADLVRDAFDLPRMECEGIYVTGSAAGGDWPQ